MPAASSGGDGIRLEGLHGRVGNRGIGCNSWVSLVACLAPRLWTRAGIPAETPMPSLHASIVTG